MFGNIPWRHEMLFFATLFVFNDLQFATTEKPAGLAFCLLMAMVFVLIMLNIWDTRHDRE